MPLPTSDQFQRDLSNAGATLHRTRTALETAQADYRKANDENRYFTEEERSRQTERVLPVLDRAEAEAQAAVASARDLAREVIRTTERTTPTLSPQDETTAASRAVFVKEDAERLPLEELIATIRQAALTGDTVSQFLYARYGRTRLGSSQSTDPAPANGEIPFTSARDDGDARHELRSLILEIETSLRPASLTALHDKAVTVQHEAVELEALVRKRPGRVETFAFQTTGEVRW